MTRRSLAFTERYQIDTRVPDVVKVDGKSYRTGDVVTLPAGLHTVTSNQPVRIRLLPQNVRAILDPAFVEEQPFYANVYDY